MVLGIGVGVSMGMAFASRAAMMFGIAMLLGVLMAVRGFAMAMFVYRLWLALAENQAA